MPRRRSNSARVQGTAPPPLLDRLCEVPEGQRLLPPEPQRPERALEALQWGLREGSPRWEAFGESGVGPRDSCSSCPLQQDLRDNDLVRRPARLAPGEGAAIAGEPGEQPPAQPGDTRDRPRRRFIQCAYWPSHQAHSFPWRKLPHRLQGRDSLLAGLLLGGWPSGTGIRTPGRRSAAAPAAWSPPAARPPGALSSGPGLRRAR